MHGADIGMRIAVNFLTLQCPRVLTVALFAGLRIAVSSEVRQVNWNSLGVLVAGRFAEAMSALPEATGNEEAKFTEAILLFNSQTRTDADMTEAIGLLTSWYGRQSAGISARAACFFWRGRNLRAHGWCRSWPFGCMNGYGGNIRSNCIWAARTINRLLLAFYACEPRETFWPTVPNLNSWRAASRTPRCAAIFIRSRPGLLTSRWENSVAEHLLKVTNSV